MPHQTKLDFILSVLRELHPYEEINEDTELINSGLLDSLSILFVISQIEEHFNIEISEDFVQPQYFSSPLNIVELVQLCSS